MKSDIDVKGASDEGVEAFIPNNEFNFKIHKIEKAS
jgi:hypothetical protein